MVIRSPDNTWIPRHSDLYIFISSEFINKKISAHRIRGEGQIVLSLLKKSPPVHKTSGNRETAQFKAQGQGVQTTHCLKVRGAIPITGYYPGIDFSS